MVKLVEHFLVQGEFIMGSQEFSHRHQLRFKALSGGVIEGFGYF